MEDKVVRDMDAGERSAIEKMRDELGAKTLFVLAETSNDGYVFAIEGSEADLISAFAHAFHSDRSLLPMITMAVIFAEDGTDCGHPECQAHAADSTQIKVEPAP